MAKSATKAKPMAARNVHEELLDAAIKTKASFSPPRPREQEQVYLKRLCVQLADADDGTWNSLSKDAQEWFNQATGAFNHKEDLPVPDGYKPPEVEAPARRSGAENMAAKLDSKRKRTAARAEPEPEPEEEPEDPEDDAEGEEPEDPEDDAEGEEPEDPEDDAEGEEPEEEEEPEPAPVARRAASRKAPAAEPPARQARQAAPQKAENGGGKVIPFQRASNGLSAVAEIRKFVVKKPTTNNDAIRAHLEKKGIKAENSTINVTRTGTLAVIAEIKASGHWAD